MYSEILMAELIGLRVRVAKSTLRKLEGVEGLVVDETLNTLVVETTKGVKRVPKALCVFTFFADGKRHTVDGRDILFRPEDRIKKYWRRFHSRMHGRKLSDSRHAKNEGRGHRRDRGQRQAQEHGNRD